MADALKCLVVGVPATDIPQGSAEADGATFIRFAELPDLFPPPESLEVVISPLFCSDFDALELLELLGRNGFRKSLRVLAPKLPNRLVVMRELRSHATRQGIKIEVIELEG
jgi:hypothetical protein